MNSSGLRRFGSILLMALGVGLLFTGCGDDTTVFVAVNWPGEKGEPSQGGGWIYISHPGEPVETAESSLEMAGTAFTSEPSAVSALSADAGLDYTITWFNDANGQGGETEFGQNRVSAVNAWRITYGMIRLEPGENHITVTADDGHGNIGRATLNVTRR